MAEVTVNTKKFLEKVYSKRLPDSEVTDSKDKLVKFFSLLIEIDQNNRKKNNETKNN